MFQYTMWMLVHPTQKVLSPATLSNEIFCCTFLIKNRINCPKYIHLFHYLNIPPGKLEHRIGSLSSLGHIICEWEASPSQPTIILDVIAVYPQGQKSNMRQTPLATLPYIVGIEWLVLELLDFLCIVTCSTSCVSFCNQVYILQFCSCYYSTTGVLRVFPCIVDE